MPGHAGTVRFGEYPDYHQGKPDANGQDKLTSQADGDFLEQHTLYDPAQLSREMGTTLGDAPGKYYTHEKQVYEAPSNHDGFSAGDAHLTNMDEGKVLQNTLRSVKIECADDEFQNWGSTERTA